MTRPTDTPAIDQSSSRSRSQANDEQKIRSAASSSTAELSPASASSSAQARGNASSTSAAGAIIKSVSRKHSTSTTADPSSGRSARSRSTNVFTSLLVRARPSSSSLRNHSHGRHAKKASTSTHRSSDRSNRTGNLSSQSSRETHSSASSISGEASTITPDAHRLAARLENPRPDRPSESSGDHPHAHDRTPSPASIPAADPQAARSKMHQTSSRLLRMTDEERPFTRDFKDLFATLIVSLPLTAHRVKFQKIEHTFTSEEAINNLASLKFSQSNRMPDPKDHSRIVTTTTTTTFSMAKEMARSVCQRFMDGRFIEPAEAKPISIFPLKGAVWQLTPKGMHVLTRFCQRNGIQQQHVIDVLDSPRNTMQLVILERDATTDKLSHDRATVEVIFRRFVGGHEGPNIKANTAASDSDSVSDYYNGITGVKMAKERKIMNRIVTNTFTGKVATDWLMDCCSTIDRRETYEIAELFVQTGLIYPAAEDKVFVHQNPGAGRFQPTKQAIYGITEKGQVVAGWLAKDAVPEESRHSPTPSPSLASASTAVSSSTTKPAGGRGEGKVSARDSNNNRLQVIVNDPALRLLFREYLRDTHCEENLAFYLEVREFTKNYDTADRANAFTRLDAVRENLAGAYGLYNAFLAPGSPCELNIDHNLRNNLAGRMTRAVGDDDSMLHSLHDVVALFKDAQVSVFKLMSSDSVPKFLKEQRYAHVLREHNFDQVNAPPATTSTTTLPERTLSRKEREKRGS